MNIYSIYVNTEKEDDSFISVKNGFSLTAAIFSFFLVLYHKMWKIALIMLAIYAVIFSQNENIIQILVPLMNVLNIFIFGMFAADIQEYHLEKNGYKLKDIVLASSLIDSEIKFLNRNNQLLC